MRLLPVLWVVLVASTVAADLWAQPAPTIIPGRGLRVIRVRFQPAAACLGVDDTINPVAAMAPVGGIKSAQATVAPANHATRTQFFSVDAGVATISPDVADGTPQALQLGGVSRGGTAIRVNTTTSGVLRQLDAFTKIRLDRTIVIHAVTEENDDVQAIVVGRGEANQGCVNSGPNGVFNSSPAGDDTVIGTAEIGTGSNGICETAASGDDVQVIPIGRGRPNSICVARGPNTFRDTPMPEGDDQVASDDIDTGADGICQTTARSTDLVPTNVPAAAVLQADLNRIWGLQANVFFTVTRVDSIVNYDLDRNGVLADPAEVSATIAEIDAIAARARSAGDFNIYFVNQVEVPQAFTLQAGGGIPANLRNSTWIQDAHANSSSNVSAHEVGHLLGSIRESTDLRDVMLEFGSATNPCEVRRVDWNTVNP